MFQLVRTNAGQDLEKGLLIAAAKALPFLYVLFMFYKALLEDFMFAVDHYLVVPFIRGSEDTLSPGQPQRHGELRDAKRSARNLARIYAGSMIIEQDSDLSAEPRLLWHSGAIPEFLFDFA